ncbi:S24 family peptidase [Leptotrichia sp. OH3620_COT-345]|uniref:S24 family peptidase n=1 Tax=Leptotrichia sp. OH3620_COT-345 TaxID=2491048 RepID=UPI001315374B|nr:S24 family peptidase [Leptotrichia sp. OH3620_COT-345]
MRFEVNDDKLLEFSNFLKKLRAENNYTFEYIRKHTGINIADLNRLENGSKKKINPFHLIELSKIYKINVLKFYEILGYIDHDKIDSYVEKNVIEEKVADFLIEKENRNQKIPLFSSISSSIEKMKNSIPESFIQFPLKNEKALKAAYLLDNTMEPTLNKGSIIIFNSDITELSNSEIGIFHYNKEYSVKRFYKVKDETILQSDNYDYPPIIIKEYDNFKILGKFVGVITI